MNKKTYIVEIDYKNNLILDDNFDENIKKYDNDDFEISFKDKSKSLFNIDSLNNSVNLYIKCCQGKAKPTSSTFPYIDIKLVKKFILNAMMYKKTLGTVNETVDRCEFYCYPFRLPQMQKSFHFYIPYKEVLKVRNEARLLDHRKYSDVINTNPHFIVDSIYYPYIFDYMFPAFFYFLFKNNLYNNDEWTNIRNILIWPHNYKL